jgi:hypothetical protein
LTNALALAINLTTTDEIILTDVVSGSTVLTGVLDIPAGSSNTQTLDKLNSALASGANLGGIAIESS